MVNSNDVVLGVCSRKGCYAYYILIKEIYNRVLNTGETFYCSAGHSLKFPGNNTTDKIIRPVNNNTNDRLKVDIDSSKIDDVNRENDNPV
jgi:hypothetical protein